MKRARVPHNDVSVSDKWDSLENENAVAIESNNVACVATPTRLLMNSQTFRPVLMCSGCNCRSR